MAKVSFYGFTEGVTKDTGRKESPMAREISQFLITSIRIKLSRIMCQVSRSSKTKSSYQANGKMDIILESRNY
jgi:hypothetical protein